MGIKWKALLSSLITIEKCFFVETKSLLLEIECILCLSHTELTAQPSSGTSHTHSKKNKVIKKESKTIFGVWPSQQITFGYSRW